MNARDRFGPNLKRIREQRGISLEQIAALTNVDPELWEGLERNDYSRWPTGIFARAFVREYARMIGVDAERTVDEFCRWFPHGDRRRDHIIRAEAELLGVPSEWHDDLAPKRERRNRPELPPDQQARDAQRARRSRLVAAGIDLLLAGAGGALLARAAGASTWPVIAATALTYHTAGLVVFGGTCGSALVDAWLRHAAAAELRRLPSAAFPRLRRGVAARS